MENGAALPASCLRTGKGPESSGNPRFLGRIGAGCGRAGNLFHDLDPATMIEQGRAMFMKPMVQSAGLPPVKGARVRHRRDRAMLAVRLLASALVLFAALGIPAGAQDGSAPAGGSVEGLVTTPDGRAVVGARVSVVGLDEPKATADQDGRFRLTSLPAGSHRVRAELEGFGRRERQVEVQAGVTMQVRVTLPFMPFTETVTVTATRGEQKLGDSPAHQTVLTRRDLQASAALALDDALKQVPSFSLFRRTSSLVSHPTTQGVSLRGVGASGASRTLVMLDGVPLNDSFGNWVYWNKIPQSQIESVEVAPGGLSNLYGSSAMAGVINVVTRRPQPRTGSLKAQGGSRGNAEADLFASHSKGPFAAAVGGAFFRTDGYELVREEQRGAVDVDAASRYRTGNWRLEYSPSPGLMLFHNGRLFAEDRENGTPLQENSTRETYLGAGLRATSADGSVWQANVFNRTDDFESTFSAVTQDRASESLSLAQDVDYEDRGANAQWSRIFGSHQLSVGGDARWMEAVNREDVFAGGSNVRDRLIPGKQLYTGAYVQDLISAGRTVLVLGVRADHWRNHDASRTEVVNSTGFTTATPFADSSETTVTPRAGLLVRVNDQLAVRGSIYRGFRAPSLNELYRPFRVGNVLTEGNAGLGPERLLGGELGINHAAGSRVFWRATAFWDRLEDPIANVTLSSTPALITRQRTNLGRARIRGVSVEADYRPAPQVRVQAAYLFSDARVSDFSADPRLEGNVLPQIPRHRASLRLDYLGSSVLNVSILGRVEGLRFDDDLNSLRLGSLFTADITLDRPIGESFGAFVAVENLFDRRYAVQATPVELLGTPLTVTAGLRVDLRPR
jgi:outer membrane cobalamin receptor